MAPFRRSGRWLDIGFGEGALLQTVEALGWECYGIEVSPHSLAQGRRRGWHVYEAHEADQALLTGTFDVATLVEVVEHLPQPAPTLELARRVLRPGGALYLTTPNANSLNRRLLGGSWSIFSPPEHLTIWSPRGLRVALERGGFVIRRLATHGFNPADLVWRVRRATAETPLPHRQRAAEALNTALSRSTGRRALKAALNGLLSSLGIGDTLKVWCEKR
jgi:SAM-dependent methyltransferase